MRMLRRAITTLSFSAMSLVLPLRRMPAVSTKTYSTPSRVTFSSTASRVVPATGETMARSWPVRVLSSVDLPTLGRPMMATLMPVSGGASSGGSVEKPSVTLSSRASMPVPCSAEMGQTLGISSVCPIAIEQGVDAGAVLGRDGADAGNPELVEFVGQDFAPGRIDLIDRQRHGLAQLAKHAGQIAVGGGDFGVAIHQEDDVGSALEDHFRLVEDLRGNVLLVVDHDAAGML